jgi:hypothetical protein
MWPGFTAGRTKRDVTETRPRRIMMNVVAREERLFSLCSVEYIVDV